ncbi:MAG: hypothetical protein ACFB3T_10275 [Geminicoccaceae bacterium]
MGSFSSVAQLGLNTALGAVAKNRENSAIERDYQGDVEALRRAQAEAERERRDKLNRMLASERAKQAAGGVAGSSSSAAVLRGLIARSDAEARAEEAETQARIDSLRADSSQKKRNNLLDFGSSVGRNALGTLGSGRSLLG